MTEIKWYYDYDSVSNVNFKILNFYKIKIPFYK